MAIATVLGAIAGWAGGIVDTIITRSTDAVFAIPIILSALVVFGLTDERTVLAGDPRPDDVCLATDGPVGAGRGPGARRLRTRGGRPGHGGESRPTCCADT